MGSTNNKSHFVSAVESNSRSNDYDINKYYRWRSIKEDLFETNTLHPLTTLVSMGESWLNG